MTTALNRERLSALVSASLGPEYNVSTEWFDSGSQIGVAAVRRNPDLTHAVRIYVRDRAAYSIAAEASDVLKRRFARYIADKAKCLTEFTE